MKYWILIGWSLLVLEACHPSNHYNRWEVYGGSKESIRYSELEQINPENIHQLRIAWINHTGDAEIQSYSQIQCNPIIIDSILYATSPKLRLLAIQASTGKTLWKFNPDTQNINTGISKFIMNNNRGVTYWSDGLEKRIFYVAGSNLYAINALNGKIIQSFGENGKIDLHNGFDQSIKDKYITATSPGIIYKDLLIIGSRVNETSDAAPGDIRAFNVRTGKIEWVFHTIPHPGELGFNSWEDPEAYKHIGSANSWSGFSLDESKGLVFVPTGSAVFDFYGGKRKGNDLFANCILALEAGTGKLVWYYQVVHHDLWDKDLPCPPSLVKIQKDGKEIEAIAQVTKHGFIFILDRMTGQPIFPIKETLVPTHTDLIGEKVWPSQPIPSLPEPFARQNFTEKDINPYLPDTTRENLIKSLKTYRYGNMFIPPGKITSVIFPGFDGGAEWGGPAYDPLTHYLYVNSNQMGWLLTMIPSENKPSSKESYLEAGERLYKQNCMGCHGLDKKGSGNYPSLMNLSSKYNAQEISGIVSNGRRMMPSFRQLNSSETKAIIGLLLHESMGSVPFPQKTQKPDSFLNLPYQTTGYHKFISSQGEPAIGPPWGVLSAINLNTGKIAWKIPLGEDSSLAKRGIFHTGTENYGGPVVTKSGIVFIAATRDQKIRGFDKLNGRLLWEASLPASAFATPSIYEINHKEFLVIACGGGKLKSKSGDSYIAFSLP